nr:RNA-directed DNA polymerase, eukaryota [Tanacetum cinerariifolium]
MMFFFINSSVTHMKLDGYYQTDEPAREDESDEPTSEDESDWPTSWKKKEEISCKGDDGKWRKKSKDYYKFFVCKGDDEQSVKNLKIGYHCQETLARLEAKGFTFPLNNDLCYNDSAENQVATEMMKGGTSKPETKYAIGTGKVYIVRAKELFTWSPIFLGQKEMEYTSDEDSDVGPQKVPNRSQFCEEGPNDDRVSDVEKVSETNFGDNLSIPINHIDEFEKQQSEDPFNIYRLLRKQPGDESHEQPDHGATMMMKGEKSKPSIELRLITSEEDRISSLPDCLLVEIISRLSETKYAIRTADLDYYKAVLDDESLEMHDELNEEMLRGLLFSLGHAKEVKIGELCLEALAGRKARGLICPSNLKIDMYIDHFSYDIMEMVEYDRNEELRKARIKAELDSNDDDYHYSDDDLEEIENIDFHTEGDDSVVIKNITTQDPILTKLCNARILFRGNVEYGLNEETPQVDPDDNQIDHVNELKRG